MNYTRDKKTLLTVYFGCYYAVLLFFFIDSRLLSQYQPIFFHFNHDLTEFLLIATGIPKWMIANPVSFLYADVLVLLAPAVLLGFYLKKGQFSPFLGVLFSFLLGFYLLLANIFWQVHYEPFVLYLLLSVAFWTNSEKRFYSLLSGCRYYFLYIFVSAALWKLLRGGLFNVGEMSRILLLHHSDLLSGACNSLSCRVYYFLIGHPALSWWLYFAGVLLEGSFIIGFFTRRRDTVLLGFAVLFVVADLLVMRIPYWTILMGAVTLWIGPGPRRTGRRRAGQRRSGQRRSEQQRSGHRRSGAEGDDAATSGIIIYETTHHENLPALLDLSEANFSRVVVWLQALSYENLSGKGSPAQRWPKTQFVVQETGCPNRTFIRRMFGFLKKEGFSHLHLGTLDNNLLFFACKLWSKPYLHVSLTVHEVNEYFALSVASLRDVTESVAKWVLHRRIGHHTMFLPAMAGRFKQRLPGTVAVFIPSRFYQSPAPGASTTQAPATASSLTAQTPAGVAPAAQTPAAATPIPPFRVVIPGSVDPNRRNYDEVVNFFTDWLTRAIVPSRPIELVILGDSNTPFGTRIIAALQNLGSPFFRLIHYQGYVPELVYERQIETADLLWSPLKVNKKSSRNSPETYGQTTASGLTADLLLNNIPALAPAGFDLPGSFQPALLSYSSPADLHTTFRRLLEDTIYYRQLRGQIHAAFSWFAKENFNKAFELLTGLDQRPGPDQEGKKG
ncbi:MAG TPA: hypothetical protein VGN00_04920 [Puia sp.]|jgi:hypothetical protein